MKIGNNKKALKKVAIGRFIGLGVVPLILAFFMLYLPALGYDPVYGDIDVYSIIHEGYVITSDDVDSIRNLVGTLSDIAMFGLICGLIGAVIGFILSRENTGGETGTRKTREEE